MKKIGALLFILLILPLALAVEFDVKDNYEQGETLIVKLSGNFINPVSEDNVLFYKRHMRVPMDFGITEIEDEFYIYALLPENKDNYSISIEDAEYYVGSEVSDENIVRNFLILNKTAVFSVEPGFVVTDKSFKIKVQNLQENKIVIAYGFNLEDEEEVELGFWASLFGGGEDEEDEEEIKEGESIELKSGEIEEIEFNVGEITESFLSEVRLSSGGFSYKIPVYFLENYVEVVEEELICCEIYGYGAEMEKVNVSYKLLKESECNVSEEFVGGGREVVDDEYCELIVEGEIIIEGEIVVVNKTEEKNESLFKTCAEYEGEFCEDDENCDGDSVEASDGVCCLEKCKKQESSSAIKIIGWIIVVAVIGFLIWFFKFKYRGAKRKVDLMDVAKKGAGKSVR